LFDRDAPPDQKSKYEVQIAAFNAVKNVYAIATSRREMENYIHPQAIRNAYAQDHPDLVLPETFSAQDDVPDIVAKAIHEKESDTPWNELNDKKKKSKEGNVKKRLSSSASAFMTVKLIDEVDVDGEVVGWLQKISELLEESP
jgi:putative ATP-dependent endonuclease of the OLD family